MHRFIIYRLIIKYTTLLQRIVTDLFLYINKERMRAYSTDRSTCTRLLLYWCMRWLGGWYTGVWIWGLRWLGSVLGTPRGGIDLSKLWPMRAEFSGNFTQAYNKLYKVTIIQVKKACQSAEFMVQ